MRYVALLRAVNVGGRTVKMDRLRGLFEEMRLQNVQTYIASGNVIFDSTAGAASLEVRVEKHLVKALGFDVPTLIRSASDLIAAADHEPFASHPPLAKAGALYVGFLKDPPAKDALQRVGELADGASTFALHDRELYWRAEDRRAVLEIPIAKFERVLGCAATFRNVTTVRKLADRYCR